MRALDGGAGHRRPPDRARSWGRGPLPVWVVMLVGVMAAPAKAQSARDAGAGWELTGRSDGISVYRKEVPGSPLIAFMGEGLVDASLAKVASVVIDATRTPEWVEHVADSRVLRQISPQEWIQYTHVAMPFIIKDREFVDRTRLDYWPDTRTMTVRVWSVDEPGVPPTGRVRGRLVDSSFRMTSVDDDRRTLVVCEVHADPRGHLPKFVVNLFQRSWPHDILAALRRQVGKGDVRLSPLVLALLGKPR